MTRLGVELRILEEDAIFGLCDKHRMSTAGASKPREPMWRNRLGGRARHRHPT